MAMLRYGHISSWDTSHVTNMNSLFTNADDFNDSLNDWDVSNVVSMRGMFAHTKTFNQPFDRWDVRKVKDMRYMFRGALGFNQSLLSWQNQLNKDVDTSLMFKNASSLDKENVCLQWSENLHSASDPVMRLCVRSLTGKHIGVDIKRSDSIIMLKEKIYDCEGIPPDQCRLIFAGKQLENHMNVFDYNISDGATVHIVLKFGSRNNVDAEHGFEQILNYQYGDQLLGF
jgi:hypothetical protein